MGDGWFNTVNNATISLGWMGFSDKSISRLNYDREFSENRYGLIQTRQTNVRTEDLFQVDF